jgi:predicted nucleotidyltransferase
LKIVLFGSYAYGRPSPNSDVDLLVIMPSHNRPVHEAARIQARLPPFFPVDLLVRSPNKVRRRIALGDGFMQTLTFEKAAGRLPGVRVLAAG